MLDSRPLLPLLIAAVGLAIASVMLNARRRSEQTVLAIILLTVATSIATAAATGLPKLPSADDVANVIAAALVAYLAIFPAGDVIGWALRRRGLAPTAALGTPGTGRLIGRLERTLMVVAVPSGGPEAVALLFAAKQLARIPALTQAGNDEEEAKAAEYLLVGSLLSALVGLAGGLAVGALLA